jgi:RNA polymerase sigma-70 factor (ECF subfamily)
MDLVVETGVRHSGHHRSRRTGALGQARPAVDDSSPATLAGGDATAILNMLYARYWTDLVRYVNGMLSDLHQAEEIAQETMLRAWRHADKFIPERGSVWSWLCRVAHNLVVDHIRRRWARPVEVEETATTYHTPVATDHSLDVARSLYTAQALARLQPAHRAVLYLVYYQDRTCAQAAAALGVPVGTVKSRLYYALRHLRAALEQDRAEHE